MQDPDQRRDIASHCGRRQERLTSELDVQSAELELHALQRLADGLVVVADAGLVAAAERQREVAVGLLAIVVRPDSVHP